MISMEKTGFKVALMVFFLGFSCLLNSCIVVPATRSLKSNTELFPISVQDLLAQNVRKSSETEKMTEEYLRHASREDKMLMENTQDYPSTGANSKHDPQAPIPPLP